mgnify:FL=1
MGNRWEIDEFHIIRPDFGSSDRNPTENSVISVEIIVEI